MWNALGTEDIRLKHTEDVNEESAFFATPLTFVRPEEPRSATTNAC